MSLIKGLVSALTITVLLSPIPSCGIHVAECKERAAQQAPRLEEEVIRLLPAGSVKSVELGDDCQADPDSDGTVVVTVSGVDNARKALAAFHREGWHFTRPFAELDPSDIQEVATKKFAHGEIDVLMEGPSDDADSDAPVWYLWIDYSS
ncbi:hypothetical protein AB0D67_07340 [Streptosporangium sp. NPDC048047]|uniref:hypothetical protein n=1 Tax=Streptosporangium sp. NPDC048047 TaxID=3155748 RepID=UPI0034339348